MFKDVTVTTFDHITSFTVVLSQKNRQTMHLVTGG